MRRKTHTAALRFGTAAWQEVLIYAHVATQPHLHGTAVWLSCGDFSELDPDAIYLGFFTGG